MAIIQGGPLDFPAATTYAQKFPQFRMPEGLTIPSSFTDVTGSDSPEPSWRYKTARGEAILKVTAGHRCTLILFKVDENLRGIADNIGDSRLMDEVLGLPMIDRIQTCTNGLEMTDMIQQWFAEIGES